MNYAKCPNCEKQTLVDDGDQAHDIACTYCNVIFLASPIPTKQMLEAPKRKKRKSKECCDASRDNPQAGHDRWLSDNPSAS